MLVEGIAFDESIGTEGDETRACEKAALSESALQALVSTARVNSDNLIAASKIEQVKNRDTVAACSKYAYNKKLLFKYLLDRR